MNKSNKYQVVFVAPNQANFRAKDGTVKPMFPDTPLRNTECNSFAAATRIASSLNHETKGITGHYRAAKIINCHKGAI